MVINKIIADIAEYNLYKLEIKNTTLEEANEIVLNYNKMLNNNNSNIKIKRLDVSVGHVFHLSPNLSEIDLICSEFKNHTTSEYQNFQIHKIKEIIEEDKNFKFTYIFKLAEYNRYEIEHHTDENLEYSINLINSNFSKPSYSYHPTLIDIATKERKTNQNSIIILETFTKKY